MSNNIEETIISAEYVFAKSMPYLPHSYTVRDWWTNQDAFKEAVQFIRDKGVKERFGKRYFVYWYCAGYKYWTMGSPIQQTKLINRAKA